MENNDLEQLKNSLDLIRQTLEQTNFRLNILVKELKELKAEVCLNRPLMSIPYIPENDPEPYIHPDIYPGIIWDPPLDTGRYFIDGHGSSRQQ